MNTFFYHLLERFVHIIVAIGDFSITKCCYFFFNEDALDERLYQDKLNK